MPIPLPRLDDRNFADLVSDGLAQARASCPDWTDHSPGDPGVTLIEVFAFLTEALLYRLNRVPAKLQLALLNLAGVTLRPPTAAVVGLTFSRQQDGDDPIAVPAGTRVATRDGSVTFVLPAGVALKAGDKSVQAEALHCELVEGELLGTGNGVAGLGLAIARPPVIASTPDGLDFVLGVEVDGDTAKSGRPLRSFDGRTFELWQEVADFAGSGADDRVYRLDRASGAVQFGPSAGAGAGTGAIPAAGRQIRAWYRRGGGKAGNVAADTLVSIKGGPEGVEVTNPERAAGGTDAETIEALVQRAPGAISSLRVVVTARDYEQVILETGGFARALSYAQAQVWRHAPPGVVEVAVVPLIDTTSLADGAVTADVVVAHRVEALRQRALDALEQRRPLGVGVAVAWAQVRPVSVSARIVIGAEADPVAVERGIRRRINGLFSPLYDLPFGRQLRASEVYERILDEPGVRYADQLTFTIGETPERNVVDLIHDPAQAGVWFAVTDTAVHRTLDDGDSWSSVFAAADDQPRFLRRHATRPGLLVLGVARKNGSAIHISADLGESWTRDAASFSSELFDAAWIERDASPMLLLATGEGLRQFVPDSGHGPAPVIVDKALDTKGFYSVASSTSPSGIIAVAVAARAEGGIYLSSAGGVSETFHAIGLKGQDVRQLVVQATGGRNFLWATIGAEAGEAGEGAYRVELRANGADDPGGFKPYNIGWQGGSCEALAFADALVVAGSNRSGVLTLDTSAATPAWQPVKLDAGLPIRDTERLLEVVATVAAATLPDAPPILLSGGIAGVHRSLDGGETFALASASTFTDRVPLPPRWLYCAGTHKLTIVHDMEGRG
ncbi:MAG: baseplate J/gp47 family protein [Sphingomonadales bacterium]